MFLRRMQRRLRLTTGGFNRRPLRRKLQRARQWVDFQKRGSGRRGKPLRRARRKELYVLTAKVEQFRWQSGLPSLGTAAHTEIAAETSQDVVVDAITAAEDPGQPGPSMRMQMETHRTPSRI